MTKLEEIRQRLEAATPHAASIMPSAKAIMDLSWNAYADIAYLLKRVERLEEALRQIRANDLAKVYGGFGLGLKPVSKIASEALEEEK